MAKTSAPARTQAIDVAGSDAVNLAAAWRGIYHFLGGQVENWEVVSPTEDTPEGGLIAHGFSINASHGVTPEQVISDISGRNRRLELFPFYSYLNGATPAPFTTAQDMTNYGVQYYKGSVEEGTAKTPEYFRKAVQDYKSLNNMRTRRGPKTKVLRLDKLGDLTPEQIRSIDPVALSQFLEMAQSVQDSTNTESATAAS